MKLKFEYFGLLLIVFFLLVKFTGGFIPIPLTELTLFCIGYGFINVLTSREFKNQFLSPVTLFLLSLSFSLIWSKAYFYGSSKLFVLIGAYLSLLFLSNIIVKHVKIFNIILSSVFGLVSIYLLVFQADVIRSMVVYGESGGRYRITDELNSNVISVFFSIGLLSSIFSILIIKKRFGKIIFSVLSLILLVFLFFTGSRGALLSLIVSAILCYTLYKTQKFYITIIIILFLGILFWLFSNSFLLMLQAFLPSSMSGFIESRFTGDSAVTSIYARQELYNLAIDGFLQGGFNNLLFGHGTGSYGFLLTGGDSRGYPHNIVLELLYENGLVFVIWFLYFIKEIMVKNYNIIKNQATSYSRVFFFILFYFLLLNSFGTGDLSSNFLLFNLMAIIFYINEKNKERK